MRLATPTEIVEDFVGYYTRASVLNRRNAKLLHHETKTDCELQNEIPIYDTVWRRWAGFSKIPEDLWWSSYPDTIHAGKRIIQPPVLLDRHLSTSDWLYMFLLHRVTGSGASFEHDHGYRNSIIPHMVNSPDTAWIQAPHEFVRAWTGKLFTSIGNQPPAFNKPPEGSEFTTGGKAYLCLDAPKLCRDLTEKLEKSPERLEIKPLVEWLLKWHRDRGMKQYIFVLTAFAMDVAEYFPRFVDRESPVYLGKNSQATCDLLFRKTGRGSREAFEEDAMHQLIDLTKDDPAGKNTPYSMEDVMCDFIRYVNNYIPKGWAKDPRKANARRLHLIHDKLVERNVR